MKEQELRDRFEAQFPGFDFTRDPDVPDSYLGVTEHFAWMAYLAASTPLLERIALLEEERDIYKDAFVSTLAGWATFWKRLCGFIDHEVFKEKWINCFLVHRTDTKDSLEVIIDRAVDRITALQHKEQKDG